MLKDLLKSMKSLEWTSSGKIGGSSENPEEHYQFEAAFAMRFLWFTRSWHSRAVEQHERKYLNDLQSKTTEFCEVIIRAVLKTRWFFERSREIWH